MGVTAKPLHRERERERMSLEKENIKKNIDIFFKHAFKPESEQRHSYAKLQKERLVDNWNPRNMSPDEIVFCQYFHDSENIVITLLHYPEINV